MKNLRPELIGFVCLFLLILSGLMRCMGDGVTKIKIYAWGGRDDTRIVREELNNFQKTHPDIQVEFQNIPHSDYETKVLTEIAAGLAPDVIPIEVNMFDNFYLRGTLEPLNPYIQADHIDLNAYYPQVLDRFTVDGQTYAMPNNTAPECVVYYNKDAFDEAGLPYPTDNWTYEDFVADAQKVMKRDAQGNVTRWGFIDDWVMDEAWVYDFGGSFTDDIKHPTKWTFATDPNTLKGEQFRADLINKYKVMPPPSSQTSMGGVGHVYMFTNRTAAMFLSGIWKTSIISLEKNLRWDVAMLPKGPGGMRGFSTGGSAFCILKSSAHKKEAWELVKYLSGPECQKIGAEAGEAQPALMKVAETTFLANHQDPQNKKMLLKAVKFVKYLPMCKTCGEGWSFMNSELDRVWAGTETAEQAMQKLKPVLEQHPPQ